VTQGWVKLDEGELWEVHNGDVTGRVVSIPIRIQKGKGRVFRVTYRHVKWLNFRVLSYLMPALGGVFWYKDSVVPQNGESIHYLVGWPYMDGEDWMLVLNNPATRGTPAGIYYVVEYAEYDLEGFVIGYDEGRQFPGPPATIGWIEFPEGGELVIRNRSPTGTTVEVYISASRAGPVTVFGTRVTVGPGETVRVEVPRGTAGLFDVTVSSRQGGDGGAAGFVTVTWKRFEVPPKPPEKPPEVPPPEEPELPESPWDALKDLLRRVLRDEEPVKIDPVVTKALIGVMFTILTYTISQLNGFVALYGLIPALLFTEWHRLITHMWLHASWEHYIGNMLFLYVFGDNMEERLGYVRYLLFYLGAGIVAGLGWVAYALAVPGLADVPAVGASGAISGVMGAYAVIFPRAHVVFLGRRMPAQVFLALWFLSQFAIAFQVTAVAWMAHVAGFVFGVLVGYLVRSLEPVVPAD
jgi:membrane associated rhomboid family serine protease